MAVAVDRIMTLWGWCQDAYARNGHKLAFPKGTDPSRTYQWRYLQALDRKLSEWEFSDRLAEKFVYVAAEFAKQNKLVHKGLAVFCQGSILRLCYHRLVEELKKATWHVSAAINSKEWLDQQVGNRSRVAILLAKDNRMAYSNIIKWYQSGHLTASFLATSIACGTVMAKLATESPADRRLLPDHTTLHCLRLTMIADKELLARLRAVLGDDWRRL